MTDARIVSLRTNEHTMIWLSAVSLIAGGLLAQRFKIIMVAPGTLVVFFAAYAAGIVQTNSSYSIILVLAIATFGVQVGYFLGMLTQFNVTAILTRRLNNTASPRVPRG